MIAWFCRWWRPENLHDAIWRQLHHLPVVRPNGAQRPEVGTGSQSLTRTSLDTERRLTLVRKRA